MNQLRDQIAYFESQIPRLLHLAIRYDLPEAKDAAEKLSLLVSAMRKFIEMPAVSA